MKTIAIISVLFAVGCAVNPQTSSTTQDTVGICTSDPLAPGVSDPDVQCPPAYLPQETIDYATAVAVGYGYLGPVSTACGSVTCTSVIGLNSGLWLNCTCSASACSSYICPGNVPLEQCTAL